jgi:hypothetical protein
MCLVLRRPPGATAFDSVVTSYGLVSRSLIARRHGSCPRVVTGIASRCGAFFTPVQELTVKTRGAARKRIIPICYDFVTLVWYSRHECGTHSGARKEMTSAQCKHLAPPNSVEPRSTREGSRMQVHDPGKEPSEAQRKAAKSLIYGILSVCLVLVCVW